MGLVLLGIITRICLILFGQKGFVTSSSIASLLGMDAVVINLAGMFGRFFTARGALFIFLIINSVNLLSKVVYGFIYGTKKLGIQILIAMLVIIGFSWLGYIFIK